VRTGEGDVGGRCRSADNGRGTGDEGRGEGVERDVARNGRAECRLAARRQPIESVDDLVAGDHELVAAPSEWLERHRVGRSTHALMLAGQEAALEACAPPVAA
jgi:hypothetical protein